MMFVQSGNGRQRHRGGDQNRETHALDEPEVVAAIRAACLRASNVATLSERFLRQSVAKGINRVSYQRADAQNEARSYNSRRKHERSPRSKSIKEDEHMHSQKNSEIRRDFTETRRALATATCLQHPERLAEARSALIPSAPPLGSHHHDQCGQYRAHDHENADDLPSPFFMM
jgi:hypothetical protein